MILFLKKKKNKQYNINTSIQNIDVEPVADYKKTYGEYASPPLIQNKSQAQELVQLTSYTTALTAIPEIKKEYPLIIKHQFPRWLRDNFDGESSPSRLIKLMQYYYEWLVNIPETLNDVDLFYLDKNYDLDRTNSSFLQHLAYTYINSLDPNQIIKDDTGGFVSQDALRNFITNIKVNFYQIKATTKSFLHIISELLEIDVNKVNITYPKQYVLRLNGGRFPWMSSYGERGVGEYSLNQNYYPSLGGSLLNRSVIHDNDFWQDYSYLIDTIDENNSEKYTQVVAPLVHPAGMRYFFESGASFFEDLNEIDSQTEYERPIIGNYAQYSLNSASTIGSCNGCYSAENMPTYVFPNWDAEIKTKLANGTYPIGLTFGSIYIGDFLELKVVTGDSYPNNQIATCDIAGC